MVMGATLMTDGRAEGTSERTKTKWPSYDGQETITDYAKRTGLAPVKSLTLGGGIAMEFVLVPPGSFMMGGTMSEVKFDWDIGNAPVHRVTFREPFYLGKYEVTVAQFRRFTEAANHQTTCEKSGKGSTLKGGKWQMAQGVSWKETGNPETPQHPVGLVSWLDADAFTKWLARQTTSNVRLPTEAQWEYAARGPKNLEYPWGSWNPTHCNHGDITLKNAGFKLGWAVGPDDNDGYSNKAPVGSYPAGASWCGAHDMAGNAWEWCRDIPANYSSEDAVDPQGPERGPRRICRGGSIDSNPMSCRSAFRIHATPGYSQTDVGFRVVLLMTTPAN
jgi:formylglycine-generating enzyme required for sulfatase activity